MKYHLIGDAGISMSGIKKLLQRQGHIVTGSDLKTGGHNAENISSDIDFVVRTSAVNPGSEGWIEVEEAMRIGIPILKRSELLGKITHNYRVIAVSGMHGKTTTTALAGLVLIEAKFDPTVLVGERVKEFGGEVLRYGKSSYFVMEACEYDKSFLDFFPEIAILTNIDLEHLDTFPGGMPEILKTFSKYLSNIRQNGILIANREDEHIREIALKLRPDIKLIWYGDGSIYDKLPFELSIIGKHNQQNALAVLALADHLGIDRKHCEKVFREYKGVKRRLEYWGEYNKALLYDDYGHHPTEIAATIKAVLAKHPDKKLTVIFWPHQYKRILPLINEFAKSFAGANNVFLKDIYLVPGRDEKLAVSSSDLAEKILERGVNAKADDNDKDIVNKIIEISKSESVILTMGIPPAYQILEKLLKE